jgi:ankyrin repeat protein
LATLSTASSTLQFFIALKTGDADTMAQLLKKDATLADTKADSDVIHINRGTTPIDWAASVGDEAVIELLLQHGVDINQATSYDTPLHCAVMAGQHQTARFLLSRKANVNASGGCDHTPLHRAVMRDDQEMVELLLKAGAQADVPDFKGQTAADWAALKGYRSLLERLVEHGARPPLVPLREPPVKPKSAALRTVPVGPAVLGRMLDANGIPLDGQDAPADTSRSPL